MSGRSELIVKWLPVSRESLAELRPAWRPLWSACR